MPPLSLSPKRTSCSSTYLGDSTQIPGVITDHDQNHDDNLVMSLLQFVALTVGGLVVVIVVVVVVVVVVVLVVVVVGVEARYRPNPLN